MKKRKDIHYSLSNIKYTEKVEIRLSIFMATAYIFQRSRKVCAIYNRKIRILNILKLAF